MPAPAEIARIAQEHAELSHTLTQFDDAPAELRNTIDLLESIEKDLKVRESRMTNLIKKRKAEHKDLDKLQRSLTKRFIVKVKHGGKEGLQRRLEKEEREYIEAAQDEHNENHAITELKAAAQNARNKKADLESQVVIRKETLHRLDDLYRSAFEGPSPDFPEEDQAEEELQEAEVHFEYVQSRLSQEKNVFKILDQAASRADQAQSALQSANLAATYDTFQIGGGIWAQMAEADDLLRAQTLAAQAHRLLERAHGLQPLVKIVPPGKIVSPEWLNVVFDNMYTDFMFQQKIKKSVESIHQYQEGIFAECAVSDDRVKLLTRDASDAREFLASRRRQLAAIRREILARVREEGGVRVFSHNESSTNGDRSLPQLPSYASSPEEGTRVLATGISIPIPAHEDQAMPPRYHSEPNVSQFNSQFERRNEGPQFAPPGHPPPGHAVPETNASSTAEFSTTQSATPPMPTPSQEPSYVTQLPLVRMPEAVPHEHQVPSSTSTHADEGPDTSAENTVHRVDLPIVAMETSANGLDRNYSQRPSFASNNPYRTAS